MLRLMKSLFTDKQSDAFNDSNWHLDIIKDKIETEFLDSKFPKKITIVEWIDDKPSKIDKRYYDITWVVPSADCTKPGLFIAFMEKEKYKTAFRSCGGPPEKFCKREVLITLDKIDEIDDKKSHPEFKCWLEVIDASFIRWVPETEEEKASWR